MHQRTGGRKLSDRSDHLCRMCRCPLTPYLHLMGSSDNDHRQTSFVFVSIFELQSLDTHRYHHRLPLAPHHRPHQALHIEPLPVELVIVSLRQKVGICSVYRRVRVVGVSAAGLLYRSKSTNDQYMCPKETGQLTLRCVAELRRLARLGRLVLVAVLALLGVTVDILVIVCVGL
jgi:hypothetical protein